MSLRRYKDFQFEVTGILCKMAAYLGSPEIGEALRLRKELVDKTNFDSLKEYTSHCLRVAGELLILAHKLDKQFDPKYLELKEQLHGRYKRLNNHYLSPP